MSWRGRWLSDWRKKANFVGTDLMLDLSETVFRLGAAVLAGGAIGLNRDLHGKAIGVRTLGIVALGAASIVLFADGGDPGKFTDTGSRIVQGILTGVGFLGAGVIIHTEPKDRVLGLTSAACTWLTACIGILCGAGQWRTVAVSFAFAFVLLLLGGRFEKAVRHAMHRERPDLIDATGHEQRIPPKADVPNKI